MTKIKVEDTEGDVVIYDDKGCIFSTDTVRYIEDGVALIEKWLCNKNTIEFPGYGKKCVPVVLNPSHSEGGKRRQVSMRLRKCIETINAMYSNSLYI